MYKRQVYYTVSDGLVLIRSSAQANVDSWTTGDMRFDHTTLQDMAKVIERRYDVKIRDVYKRQALRMIFFYDVRP